MNKLMQAFSHDELLHISPCIQRYLLHASSGKKRSKFVLDLVRFGSTLLDFSLALKLVIESRESYFIKQSMTSATFTSAQQMAELVSEQDSVSNDELAISAGNAFIGDCQASARCESKLWDIDGLAWEVECTQKVKLFLKTSHYSLELRKTVIRKIRALASGERSKSLSKRVADKLYEAKLTKSARII